MRELLAYWAGKDLRAGHVLLVDKPLGWTSYNVVGKVKFALQRRLGLRGIKVGHAGTLDPLATGLMVICIGGATKLAQGLTDADKSYDATFSLGVTTPSYDLETEPNGTFPVDHINESLVRSVASGFVGEHMQEPPLFSAKRVNGKRAYSIARSGRDAQLEAVRVRIDRFDVQSVDLPHVHASIRCSKGTYIRAIARDLGRRLNSGAHLSALRRVGSGSLRVEDALTIGELEAWIDVIARG